VKHRVVGLASGILNSGQNILSLQEGVISENLFEGSPANQELQDIGNSEAKTPNAGAASALSFFHRNSLQPLDAHKLKVYDVLGQRARKSQPGHWLRGGRCRGAKSRAASGFLSGVARNALRTRRRKLCYSTRSVVRAPPRFLSHWDFMSSKGIC